MVGRFKIPVGYSSDLECRIAELPFSSRRVSFFIILPDDVDRGIPKLEANMSSDNIKALFSTLKVTSGERRKIPCKMVLQMIWRKTFFNVFLFVLFSIFTG